MPPKQIVSFVLSAALHADDARIIFTFTDGTILNCHTMQPARFTAVIAVLHATKNAYLFFDDDDNPSYVASGRNTPGMDC